MDKQYVIFDMDGTLVDSMGYWDQVVVEYLENRGFTGDFQDLLLRIKTMSVLEGAQVVAQEFGLADAPEDITAALNAIMEQHYRRDVAPKPGIPDFLRGLKARGAKLCVASTSPQELIELCLETTGLGEMMEFCLSSELVGPGKGQPDLYLEATRRLGGSVEETAVFEDALYAMETAKKAGFYVVGIHDIGEEPNWADITGLADETMRFE